MAKVYDVKVRFMRRIQIREYEPAESEVTVSAQMGEDEDLMSVGQELTLQARELVKLALTGKTSGEATGKTKTKVTKKAAVDEIPEDSEIPGDEGPSPEELKKAAAAEKRKIAAAKRKAKKLAEKEVAEEEIPSDNEEEIPSDNEEEEEKEDSGEVTVEELASFINTRVTSRQVKPKQIKAVLAKYGASRISEVPKEKCAEAKATIQKLA